MIRQSCLALAVGTAMTASFSLYAADPSSNYQQSESVSATVYHSQQLDSGIRRNDGSVKPSTKALPATVSLVTGPKAKTNPPNNKTLVGAPKVDPVTQNAEQLAVEAKAAPKPQQVAINLPSQPAAAEPDESLLSFIDDWLGIKPVKPWQKGTLAKKEMKPGGLVPEFDVFSEKVFSYKQGSVGGNGVGGGGCGCN